MIKFNLQLSHIVMKKLKISQYLIFASLTMLFLLNACVESTEGNPTEDFSKNSTTGDNNNPNENNESETIDPTPTPIIPDPSFSLIGQAYYTDFCEDCHGRDGSGTNLGPKLISCNFCKSDSQALIRWIEETMPLGEATLCKDDCAKLTADYILTQFNDIIPEPITETPADLDLSGNDNPLAAETPTENPNDDNTATSALGQTTFAEKCAGCHGDDGTGSLGGPSLIECAACNAGFDSLVQRIVDTMPLGNSAACDNQCADPIAQYILATFTNATTAPVVTLTKAINLNHYQTLRKATLNLTGRLPTDAELTLINEQGEQGLMSALDAMMEQDIFFERLREIYNDLLHQDKYIANREAGINLLNSTDYPNRRWTRDLGLCMSNCATEQEKRERQRYIRLTETANEALAREVYYLIQHVVSNDLPFSEILTADYTMANYYSARIYEVEDQHQWRLLDANDPNYPADTQQLGDNAFIYDPSDFRPVKVPNIPHAGLLTSPMFLNRFPSSDTNRNRHRSKTVYKLFLDIDILAIAGSRPDATQALSSPTPTLDNPMCTGCHSVMDPVASLFQNWNQRGRYQPARSHNGWYTDMLPRGFNGQLMPLAGNIDHSLQWLSKQIAQNPGFAKATVKTLYKGLTGQAPLSAPTNADADDPKRIAYLEQRAILSNIEQVFIEQNWNLKTVIKAIITQSWWQVDELTDDAIPEAYQSVGAIRLLTPEMLDRKISTLTGIDWTHWRSHRLTSTSSREFRLLYGGINSDTVTARIEDPNGLMIAVQQRMANQVGCKAVAMDFYRPANDRYLLPYVDHLSLPADPSYADTAKQNIAYLHQRLWGTNASPDDSEVATSYQLLVDLNYAGLGDIAQDKTWQNKYLHGSCAITKDPLTDADLPSEQQIYHDEQYIIRAWVGLIYYMLTDFNFLYE